MHSALTVPAFVLGLGENGYGVARSLARAGVQVIGFHGEAKEFARFSRYVRPMFLGADLDDEHICDRLIDCATRCTASACPKTTRSSDSSSVRSRSRSEDDAWRAGMRAILATTASISGLSTVRELEA